MQRGFINPFTRYISFLSLAGWLNTRQIYCENTRIIFSYYYQYLRFRKNEILVTEKTCNVSFPNAFSPNKDGKNGFFKMVSSFIFQEYYLAIYNRWGQKIFETKDRSKGWDGHYTGKPQPSGIFVWYCRYKRSGIVSTM
ncbi:MAG: gliding motility-associated C-terminal domain-containing protein [Chitinophagaceae bacterium]|nr:gliding motility-associated C-terminal domain-containing protein [Chitinophagaceae bacterium]